MEALIDLGDELTLYASGASLTPGELIPVCQSAPVVSRQ